MRSIKYRRVYGGVIFSILFFALYAIPAQAATVNYYVDPAGNNSNNGLSTGSEGAWQTIQYAVSNVANPTVDEIIINVAAGTYTLSNDDIDIDRAFTNLTITGAGAGSTMRL